MNNTTRSVAEEEMSLVESEIAAQREMLKEADTTLNNILNKIENDVVDVSERDPDIRELRKFLSEQNRQTKEKLQESQGEVDQIAREKRDLEKQFKKYKEEAENQIARLRSQQNSLRKMESPKKVDKRTEQALRNEQVRMALEEKMAEMWQPEEVLQRVATFVNSNFADTGNDELSEALENIRSRAAEKEALAAKQAHAESEARNARIKRPDHEMLRKIKDLEDQLANKLEKNKMVAQDSFRDRQKIEELEQLVKDLRNRLQESNSKANEAEGAQLAQEKELKRLKANLKLSQKEDDDRKKRMEEFTGEINKLRTIRDEELNTRKGLQNENNALQRMLHDENTALLSVSKAQEEAKAKEARLASELAEKEAINQELQEELENAHQQIDDLETQLQDVEEEGQKQQRLAASRKRKLKIIKKLKTALEDVRDHVNRAIADRNHDSRMNDRFDEILEALRNLDGRMNQRGHRRTNRVLDAIGELECGLDDLHIPANFHKLNKRLNRLRDHLEVDARNKDDEFFFVPSGYRPKETTEKEEKAGVGQNADFEAHPSVFKGYVPVRAHIKETAYPVTLKIKNKKRRKERILNFYK
ncbi:unnamed protein product [Oikopleura dioica]|uniref:Uncharacterized protein n=1 Tax=Oikopleura dioica TaxID=34765 RepID=E4WVJ0_OIKDI|nr:unnamed protein product [Oikopleura dioica]